MSTYDRTPMIFLVNNKAKCTVIKSPQMHSCIGRDDLRQVGIA